MPCVAFMINILRYTLKIWQKCSEVLIHWLTDQQYTVRMLCPCFPSNFTANVSNAGIKKSPKYHTTACKERSDISYMRNWWFPKFSRLACRSSPQRADFKLVSPRRRDSMANVASGRVSTVVEWSLYEFFLTSYTAFVTAHELADESQTAWTTRVTSMAVKQRHIFGLGK